MRPPSIVRGLLCLILGSSAALASRPAKRSYSMHDYYVLEHNPSLGVSVEECAAALGAEVVEQAGELRNHWLLRIEIDKTNSDLQSGKSLEDKRWLSERDAVSKAIRHLSRQVPRQRVKRAAIPAPPPPSPENSEDSLARRIALRLGIEDPLFKDQWHLVNEEYPEHMMNATPVWDMGITGKGVTSCMVDDGVDFESDDIADNFDAESSYDFNDQEDLPKPKLSDDHHGTRCAGQIAAVKNGVCGVGIAYESKIAGVRILSGPISDVDEASALNYGYQATSIYSCSWGPSDDGRTMEAPSVLVQKAILNGVQNGRDGKGSVYVFASGNGAHSGDQCNFDGYTNSIYSVTVAAIDFQGQHPYYSESCAANMVTTYSSASATNKHIVTTDVGKNKCTRNHGGTSAAAPNAVGVFALALSVRPDLTWRDIQHLCVKTAKVINPGDSSWELTARNQPYSYKFGFGKLDAWEFVTAAQQWTSVKPQAWVEAPAVQLDNGTMDSLGVFSGGTPIDEAGVQSILDITEEMLAENNLESMEHVTIRVWIEHSRRGDVEVSLISPNGIQSVLAGKRAGDRSTDGFPGWRFMSVKHWGENPVGTWMLNVTDQNSEGESGKVIGWALSLWGSAKDASKAGTYKIKSWEELPIPFPLPENEVDVDPTVPDVPHTSAIPSTTKSIPKPTIVSLMMPTQSPTSSAASDSNKTGMLDETRYRLAVGGLIIGATMIIATAFIIVRRVRKNRMEAQRREGEGEGEGEEVRMRLLGNEAQRPVSAAEPEVLYNAEEERRIRETFGPSVVRILDDFLDDEDDSDQPSSASRTERSSNDERRPRSQEPQG